MTSLTGVVSELLILGVTLLGAVALPAMTRWRARLRRPVALPVRVRPPDGAGSRRRSGHGGTVRAQQARLLLDGDRARVVGSRLHLLLPVSLWDRAEVRRTVVAEPQVGRLTQVRLLDRDRRPWLVAVPVGWRAAMTVRRARGMWPWTRWRLAGPRWTGLVVGMLVAIAVPFHVVWWTGHDEQATVVRVIDDRTQLRCLVRWTDEHGGHSSIDDCEVGLVRPGDALEVRALAWPWRGRTMSDQTIAGVSVVTLVPAALLSVVGRTVGWFRLRRRPVALVDGGPPPEPVPPLDDPSAASLTDLWLRCAETEGWYDDAETDPPDLRRRTARVALVTPWWLLGLPLVVIGLVGLPSAWPVLVAGLLVWGAGAVAAVRSLLGVRAGLASVDARPWSYLVLRTLRDSWVALLMTDGKPVWSVDLGPDAHPPVAGTCRVRGTLRRGGRVVLDVDERTWLPIGRLRRVDAAEEAELRESLVVRVLRRARSKM
ncbi:hypothetical protein [Luteipulveratus flavus]|uniref:Uncharacterized protein n=1 Tax=Luteipulveratus flavus TaxID=3031728 RepID=A0ABT6C6X7_9MICO|nr:hypothetical protein [Luteipulveratus sp. YIM 133296]MDF8264600.1 hypothetical protein [Luteipulveratus sp. YIM 133296]